MEEQDWKNIIDELTDQLKAVSIERAVARADVKKTIEIIKQKDELIQQLQEQANAEIQTVKVEGS